MQYTYIDSPLSPLSYISSNNDESSNSYGFIFLTLSLLPKSLVLLASCFYVLSEFSKNLNFSQLLEFIWFLINSL